MTKLAAVVLIVLSLGMVLSVAEVVGVVDFLGSGEEIVINDPDAATSPVSLTSEVSGVLPQANGGSNASTDFTAGSVVFDDGTRFVQNNANLFWDNTNLGLGIGTATVGASTRLGVAGGGVFKGVLTVEGLLKGDYLLATSTTNNSGIGTNTPSALLGIGGRLDVLSSTTLNSGVNVGGKLLVKGPVSDCIETLAVAATINIDLATPCKTKVIPELTLDPTITFDNVGDGNWSGELWIYVDDLTKQPSFSSSSASYQLEIGAIKASSTPMELVQGLNIVAFKAVSTSTIPNLRLDFGDGSLPR